MTALHRARLPAVLAANPDLQIAPRAAAELHGHLDELPDTGLIEHLERILGQEPVLDIKGQEAARVVARETERRLREIVRPEGEKLGLLGNLIRRDRGTRQLD